MAPYADKRAFHSKALTIRVRTTRTACDHQQRNPQRRWKPHYFHNQEPHERQDYKLQEKTDSQGRSVSHLFLHTSNVDRSRHSKDQEKQENMSSDFRGDTHGGFGLVYSLVRSAVRCGAVLCFVEGQRVTLG